MVNDSITLKKFYRVPLDKPMLDSTTLIKLNQQYGGDTLKELNRLLMHKLAEWKVICDKKLRVDTTVVESNVHHPIDVSF